jgi:hypothetical protein
MEPDINSSGPVVSWQIIREAAAGVQDAWDAIVDAYGGLVWTAARAGQLTEERAADVSRLTWMRLHDRLGVISPDAIASWLEQTAERESLRLSRLSRLAGEGQVRTA